MFFLNNPKTYTNLRGCVECAVTVVPYTQISETAHIRRGEEIVPLEFHDDKIDRMKFLC